MYRPGLPLTALALALVWPGCSLDRGSPGAALPGNPDSGLMDSGPGLRDGGVMDAGAPDVSTVDVGRPDLGVPDAPPPADDVGTDSFVPCPVDTPRCDGEFLVTCLDGVVSMRDCAAESAYCHEAATINCEPRVCAPGAAACNDSGTVLLTCNDRGSEQNSMPCPYGCDAATTTCNETCFFNPLSIAVGESSVINLCGTGDDHLFVEVGDCDYVAADGEDALYRLEVPSPMRLRLVLEDWDAARRVDTLLYVRTRCDDPLSTTQIACSDDAPTTGQSVIERDFEPGIYFIVADHHLYSSGGLSFLCGYVRLSVSQV